MGSLAPLAHLASPEWARLGPQVCRARLGHQGSQGFGGSQGYEETRALGGPQDPLAFLAPLASLFLENQVSRGCQGPQDSGGSRGLKGSLGPQVIEASREIMEWASQGCPGPQGRGAPLDLLAPRGQQAWVNQV